MYYVQMKVTIPNSGVHCLLDIKFWRYHRCIYSKSGLSQVPSHERGKGRGRGFKGSNYPLTHMNHIYYLDNGIAKSRKKLPKCLKKVILWLVSCTYLATDFLIILGPTPFPQYNPGLSSDAMLKGNSYHSRQFSPTKLLVASHNCLKLLLVQTRTYFIGYILVSI